ncbi:MAG: glycosyltransferase family 2 protein [Actinobacteria bacterium]|nr:glycosyltransferase family 2 protein [Actinomycetota bacterium]
MSVDISVIIPLYNKGEFIERTLKSVAAQDISNWECIIFISENPGNWKLIFQKNSGQTSARNHGVRLAQGTYLAFLDADDLWPNNKLRLQFEALETDHSTVLVLSAFAIFKDHNTTARVVRHKDPFKMNKRWLLMSGFGGGLESVGMMRQGVLSDEELFDSALSTSSGLDLSLRLAEFGKIILLPEIGLYYRINAGQWHADTNELGRNLDILCERYQNRFSQNLARSHSAYLFWISARGNGAKYLVISVVRSLFTLRNGQLSILANLIWRNIASSRLGKSMRNETLSAISKLDS